MAFPGFPKALRTPSDIHVSETLVEFFVRFAGPQWATFEFGAIYLNDLVYLRTESAIHLTFQ